MELNVVDAGMALVVLISLLVGAWRVTCWGALGMAITAGVGALFGGPV